MKYLDHMWLGGGRIGLVKVETDYDGIKYYIAPIKDGNSEDEDVKYVMDWGSTVNPEVMKEFFQ